MWPKIGYVVYERPLRPLLQAACKVVKNKATRRGRRGVKAGGRGTRKHQEINVAPPHLHLSTCRAVKFFALVRFGGSLEYTKQREVEHTMLPEK